MTASHRVAHVSLSPPPRPGPIERSSVTLGGGDRIRADRGALDRAGASSGRRLAYRVAVAPSPLASLPTARDDAARIEACLLDTVRIEGDPYLSEIAAHLIKAGGKRQRPLFTVASAATALPDGTAVSDDVVRGGVSVELVQVGSLYHDDVMDEAQIRREVDSVNARWGNLRAILAGDFLLAKASEIAASLGTEVAGLLARTIGDLCRGQVAELQTLYDVNRNRGAVLPLDRRQDREPLLGRHQDRGHRGRPRSRDDRPARPSSGDSTGWRSRSSMTSST